MFIKIAWLNLVKHRRRTLLIIFAVMVSVLVMEVVSGMFHGMTVNFFKSLTREGGHVQVNAPGWKDRLNPYSLDYTIGGYEELSSDLLALPGAEAVEPILHFGALLQKGERDVTLAGMGVLPDTAYFENVHKGIQEGAFLPQGEGILLSRALCDLLKLSLGDGVNVVVEDSTGSPFYYEYPVTGIFETNSTELDENTFFLSHEAAQDLLYLPGETTEIRVRLEESSLAPGFKEAALTGPAADLTVQTWRDLNSGITAILEMMDFFILFMDLFIIIVVATVITNAILMNVFERIREFGTLRAIGLKRGQLGGMILTEGVIQGVVGALLGLALGIPIVLYYSVNGIDWGGISEALGLGSDLFYFGYSLKSSVLNALAGVFIALGGSLYAARIGGKLSIMDALRYV